MVVDQGFAWNGKTYDSLSKIALAITGTKWNGPRFFGLRDKIHAEAKPCVPLTNSLSEKKGRRAGGAGGRP
jgi:hypothetical protein